MSLWRKRSLSKWYWATLASAILVGGILSLPEAFWQWMFIGSFAKSAHSADLIKAVGVGPQPNSTRHADARWDAYFSVADPDALVAEFTSRGVVFSVPSMDTHDGLRGFEVKDVDGYVLFFGRPREG
jgi:hypothetical protein